jgi:hypothetical protein
MQRIILSRRKRKEERNDLKMPGNEMIAALLAK